MGLFDFLGSLFAPAPKPQPQYQAGGLYAGPVARQFDTNAFRLTGQNIPSGIPAYSPPTVAPKTVTTGGVSTGGGGNTNQNQNNNQNQNTNQNQPSQQQSSGPSAEEIARQQQEAYNNAISSAYSPALSALDEWMKQLETNKTQNYADVTKSYGEGQQSIAGQQKEGQEFQANQQSDLSQNLNSALSDAVRYYNALRQQGQAIYGGGSSTGGAVGELAQQAFLKSQGQIQNTAQQGFQAIQAQTQKLQNYVQEKTSTLDQWKRQAEQQIKDNFTSSINQINAQKGMVEANKTNAKLQALQQAQADARTIAASDQTNRQQLAAWAVQTAQQAAQRAFTPQEIASIYNNMMGQNLAGFTGQRVVSPSAVAQVKATGTGKSVEDLLREQGLL